MNFEDIVFDNFVNDLEDVEDQENNPSREFLTRKNTFELSDSKYIKYFRFSKNLAREVIELVTPFIQVPTRDRLVEVFCSNDDLTILFLCTHKLPLAAIKQESVQAYIRQSAKQPLVERFTKLRIPWAGQIF